MIHYIYDGTFEGLLTVLAKLNKEQPEEIDITIEAGFEPNLFSEIITIATDPVIAGNFFQELKSKATKDIMMDIAYSFLSEVKGIEIIIYRFISLIYIFGKQITRDLSNDIVFTVHRISDQVGHEIHRLHGFVRFRKLNNGFYYAPIEPDHNVVQFLAPHFTARFADQKWVIHDLKRKKAIYYDGLCCRFLPFLETSFNLNDSCLKNCLSEIVFAGDELNYQNIWDEYFNHITIIERINPKLQRQRMPQRYWKHLTEKVKPKVKP